MRILSFQLLQAGVIKTATVPALLLVSISAFASDDLYSKLEQSHWIAQGNGKNIVYMIADPDCIPCWEEYMYVQGLLKKSSKATVRWVPVAIFKPERSESRVQAALEQGNIDGLMHSKIKPSKNEAALAIENRKLIKSFDVQKIPLVVSKNKTILGLSKEQVRELLN
jgi:hypothetical protein